MTELERQLLDALTGQVETLQKRIETRMQALTESMNSLTRVVDRHAAEAAQLERQVEFLAEQYTALAAQLRRL